MEFKCEELAKIMFDSVYPRLLELMRHINVDEVKMNPEGSKQVLFNDEGLVRWMNSNGAESCSEKINPGKGICPVLNSYSDSSLYINYCNAMMDKIEELERELNKFDIVIERASRIGVTYERKILIEKTEQQ
jgi:hypothetical protein